MKKHVPWFMKIIIKIILSRIHFNYRLWEHIGLFKHGYMTDPEYAYRVFEKHFYRVEFKQKKNGFIALELGPGDSLFSSIIARSFGAKICYMVDTGAFASMDKKVYKPLVDLIKKKGYVVSINLDSSVSGLIKNCGGIYCIQGLASLKSIPDQSVDFVWSQAVLEHVRYHEFDETMSELKRILRKDGVCSHRVDLKDHLGGGANNLRFSSKYWESDWMSSSGFYTNRIRFKEMISRFEKAGFNVEIINCDNWDEMPITRNKLAKEFSEIEDEELIISGFDVVLKLPD